jgi:hypothetical protein
VVAKKLAVGHRYLPSTFKLEAGLDVCCFGDLGKNQARAHRLYFRTREPSVQDSAEVRTMQDSVQQQHALTIGPFAHFVPLFGAVMDK